MRSFQFQIVDDPADAVRRAAASGRDPDGSSKAQFLAGGTTMVDLMKLDVLKPSLLVDINALSKHHGQIEISSVGLKLGALVKMSDAAEHPGVLKDYPAIAQSLQLAASQQLRNMASLSGNVLQRTRCSYYRDPTWTACNKRTPGSGCAAINGVNRRHAVLGGSSQCIATYPGDFANVLVALDASVEVLGANGARTLRMEDLHRLPGEMPHLETVLEPGDLVTAFTIPAGAWTRRSLYLKVRDRESYEFAQASAAVALAIGDGKVTTARIAVGGVAAKPWRAHEAEAALIGAPMTEAMAEQAAKLVFEHAVTRDGNAHKPELGRRTVVRALLQAASMEISNG